MVPDQPDPKNRADYSEGLPDQDEVEDTEEVE